MYVEALWGFFDFHFTLVIMFWLQRFITRFACLMTFIYATLYSLRLLSKLLEPSSYASVICRCSKNTNDHWNTSLVTTRVTSQTLCIMEEDKQTIPLCFCNCFDSKMIVNCWSSNWTCKNGGFRDLSSSVGPRGDTPQVALPYYLWFAPVSGQTSIYGLADLPGRFLD